MKKFIYVFLCLLIINTNNVNASVDKQKEQVIIRIGSGNILQNYYSIGLKLCKFIKASDSNVGCDVIPTKGSVDNLKLLKEGKLDLALVQADVAMEAHQGKGYFAEFQPFNELLQIFSLHDEIFTVLVKDQDRLKVFGDIEGKKIVNGPPGSGSTITYNTLKKYYKFDKEPIDIELNEEDYADKFCKGEIDALIMMTGHPNALTSLISHNCEVDFVSIEQNKTEAFLKDNIAFHQSKLHKGFYPGITEDQNTFATSTILVATDKINKKLLTNFVNYFYNNFDKFKSSNILLQNLNKEDLEKQFVLPSSTEFLKR